MRSRIAFTQIISKDSTGIISKMNFCFADNTRKLFQLIIDFGFPEKTFHKSVGGLFSVAYARKY